MEGCVYSFLKATCPVSNTGSPHYGSNVLVRSVLLICVVFCVVGLGLFVFVLCLLVLRSEVRVAHFVLS